MRITLKAVSMMTILKVASCATPATYEPPDGADGQSSLEAGLSRDSAMPTPDASTPDGPTLGLDGPAEIPDGQSSEAPAIDSPLAPDSHGMDGAVDVATADVATTETEMRLNWMFTTSTSYLPALGGLAGADAECMKRAQAAKLTGTFVALLSTGTVDARSRLGNSRGWVRTDGTPFASTQQQLFTGAVGNPPMLDEFAKPIDPDTYAVFTASKPDGTPYDGASTTDWTNPQPDRCRVGNSYKVGIEWLSATTVAPCNGRYRLYCFEIGRF